MISAAFRDDLHSKLCSVPMVYKPQAHTRSHCQGLMCPFLPPHVLIWKGFTILEYSVVCFILFLMESVCALSSCSTRIPPFPCLFWFCCKFSIHGQKWILIALFFMKCMVKRFHCNQTKWQLEWNVTWLSGRQRSSPGRAVPCSEDRLCCPHAFCCQLCSEMMWFTPPGLLVPGKVQIGY